MFSFWESPTPDDLPPPPARSAIFVMRNGRYEPQNLMPVLPRPDILDFDGFVARRGASTGYLNVRAPEMRQVLLTKSPVSIRRDSARVVADPRRGIAPAAGGVDAREGAGPPGGLIVLRLTFDAIRPGRLSMHLVAAEVESSTGAEQCIRLLPQDAAALEESSMQATPEESSLVANTPPPPMTAADERPLDEQAFEPGLGQVYESPAFDPGSWPAEALAFNPDAPSRIPVAVRLEANSQAGEEVCVHYTYVSLQKVPSSPSRGGGDDGSGKEERDPPQPQWSGQIFAQKMQYGSQHFILHDVFGVSSKQDHSAEMEGGNSDCVICLSEPRDTAVLPCRHMCFCSYCAGIVRLQCDRCPVCRQKVASLLQFKREREPQPGSATEEVRRGARQGVAGKSAHASSSAAAPPARDGAGLGLSADDLLPPSQAASSTAAPSGLNRGVRAG